MRIQYITWALVAFLAASCSEPKEEGNEKSQPSHGKVAVTVSVTLSKPELVKASTRAYTDTDIRNFDLLVFDENTRFLERVKVERDKLTPGEGGGVSFTVNLTPTPKKRIVHLVANGRRDTGSDRLYFSYYGLEKDVIPIMKAPYVPPSGINTSIGRDSVFAITPLIMWGRFVLDNGITAGTTVSGVKLLRMAANIQVKKGTPRPGNGLDDFVIEGISLERVSAYGLLTPTDFTGVASIPTTVTLPNNFYTNYLEYYKYSIEALGPEPSIYVYEQPASDGQMKIMLKASYKGVSGYYKLIMADADGNILDVIRNHRYILTIVGVDAPGFPTIAAATASPAYGVKLEVTDDHEDLPIVATRGGTVLALSSDEVIFYGGIKVSWQSTTSIGYNSAVVAGYFNRPFLSPSATEYPVVTFSPPGAVGLSIGARLVPGGGGTLSEGKSFSIQLDGGSCPNAPATFSTIMTVTSDKVSIPVHVTWIKDIGSVFQQSANSYVLDLVDPTDKNWNIRILEAYQPYGQNSGTPLPLVAGLHPSAGSPDDYPGNGMLTELSSKYHSHAYLHVGRLYGGKGYTESSRVILQKTSVSGGKLVVRRIIVFQYYY